MRVQLMPDGLKSRLCLKRPDLKMCDGNTFLRPLAPLFDEQYSMWDVLCGSRPHLPLCSRQLSTKPTTTTTASTSANFSGAEKEEEEVSGEGSGSGSGELREFASSSTNSSMVEEVVEMSKESN
uniref:Uncharacterized protein n=1 Tax=Plectus sambesii TaxID=2011161 RepID=A0A914UUU5_9BILA